VDVQQNSTSKETMQ